MTAEQFAELVEARPQGRGKWIARCPAHGDRHPSMSIKQGTNAVLVHCWSQGCTVQQICVALRLRVRDLFNDSGMTPKIRAEAAEAKRIRDEQKRHERDAYRRKRDRVWKLQEVMDGIAARLARHPQNHLLGYLFDRAIDLLQTAETELYPVAPELGGVRLPPPTPVPLHITIALAEIGRDFKK